MKTYTISKNEKIQSIFVIGRKWFEKVNGNTYHSSEAYINSVLIGRIDYNYGYGEQYIQTAIEIMKGKGFLGDIGNRSLWRYCEENDIRYVYSESNVSRKKDL